MPSNRQNSREWRESIATHTSSIFFDLLIIEVMILRVRRKDNAIAGANGFQFMTTMTRTAIGWLRWWQEMLIRRMGSKCPYFIKVRWTSVSKVVCIRDLLYWITGLYLILCLLFPLLLSSSAGNQMDAQQQSCSLSVFWREMICQWITSRVVDGCFCCEQPIFL